MKRKLAIFAVLAALVVVLLFWSEQFLTLERLAAEESRLRTLLANRPLTSFAVGYLAYALVSLAPGTLGKSLIFGWLFGLWQGVLLSNLGLTTAALLSFFISRYLIRDAVQSRFGYHLYRLNEALRRDGAFYLFTLRVMHALFTFTNYAMGATSIRTRQFWSATQLGMLPGNIVFVYAGTQIPTAEELMKKGLAGVFSWQLVAIFLVVGIFPLTVRWAIRRFWKRAD